MPAATSPPDRRRAGPRPVSPPIGAAWASKYQSRWRNSLALVCRRPLRTPTRQNANEAMVMMDRRILVVDDSPDVRRIVAWALREAGHSVLEAEDGAVA